MVGFALADSAAQLNTMLGFPGCRRRSLQDRKGRHELMAQADKSIGMVATSRLSKLLESW